MGREIRRVPPNWEHPQEEKFDPFRHTSEIRYKPMRDGCVEDAWADWQGEYAVWLDREHDRVIAEYGEKDYPKNEPYRAFCHWHGEPPTPDYYRPAWDEAAATWFQVYETVSEGTPVTPPFASEDQLIDYLVANGDFWDQKRRAEKVAGGHMSMNCDPWERQHAESFVRSGWAPSMMVVTTAAGTEIKEPKDGI